MVCLAGNVTAATVGYIGVDLNFASIGRVLVTVGMLGIACEFADPCIAFAFFNSSKQGTVNAGSFIAASTVLSVGLWVCTDGLGIALCSECTKYFAFVFTGGRRDGDAFAVFTFAIVTAVSAFTAVVGVFKQICTCGAAVFLAVLAGFQAVALYTCLAVSTCIAA